jgi:hypothetical protein
LAEQIKVITNGGGTSQGVLDTLTSLQDQIDLISSALVYKGTWNASTNTPTLASGVGTANTFYIVSVAGSTTLNGVSNWGVGDWATFNGTIWQRVEGGAAGNFTELSVSGVATFSAGTAALPAITTTGDTNTGIFFPAADTIAFTEGGAEVMRINSSGNVGIGVTPTNKLDVSGTGGVIAQIAGTTRASLRLKGSFAGTTDIGHFSVFNASDIEVFDIATTSDDTATPTSRAEFAVSAAGVSVELMRLSGSVGTVFNEDGGDYDFRVESDTNTHALFVQGSDGNVGIGTSVPNTKLEISGNNDGGASNNTLRFSDSDISSGASQQTGRIEFYTSDATPGPVGVHSFILSSTEGTTGLGALSFGTGQSGSAAEQLRITSGGNVGIGTSSPSASAILDAQSTTKGVRMPNMTTTQKNAIASPAAGLMVFDTTLAKLCVYSGSAWQTITSI